MQEAHNLHLQYVTEWAEGLSGDAEDDTSIATILPSYHMYNSTFCRRITETNFPEAPPHYELRSTSATLSAAIEEGAVPWEDTILANVDKLKKLHNINRNLASKLSLNIFFTKAVGKVGEKPEIINARDVRLQQGKFIYGYVTINNAGDVAIPFEMFSVVLQGSVDVGGRPGAEHFTKPFLTMFDYNASWNDAYLSRFAEEVAIGPFTKPPDIVIDPVDSTKVSLEFNKLLLPGTTYKKFFAFKLPEKLLDQECPQSLIKHLQLPPSLGISSKECFEFRRSKYGKSRDKNSPQQNPVTNDLGFEDCSIAYSVCVRIISRVDQIKSFGFQYYSSSLTDNEAVIAAELDAFIKVVPSRHPLLDLNRAMIDNEGRAMHENLVNKVEEIIKTGNVLTRRMSFPAEEGNDSSFITSFNQEIHKIKQSYYRKFKPKSKTYEVFLPLRTKNVLSSKLTGLITFSTPRETYHVDIRHHNTLQEVHPGSASTISIPITSHMCYDTGDVKAAPKISVDLVSLTVKSKHLPIPFVFSPESLFENSSKKSDNFDHIVIKQFQEYAKQLSPLLKTHGVRNLGLDKQTMVAIKCVANLASKYVNLQIPNVMISSEKTSYSTSRDHRDVETVGLEWEHHTFSDFVITVDIANAINKATSRQDFKLIPDFQSCLIARFYYLEIKLAVGFHYTKLKVPVNIQYAAY